MKVLFVDHTSQCGGAELMMADLMRGLRDKADVSAVLFEEGALARLLRKEDFAVDVLPLKLRTTKEAGLLKRLLDLPALGLLALRLATKLRNFDLIYANTPKALLAGAIASRLSGKRLAFHLHDILDETHFSAGNVRLLINLLNKRATAVVANSEATRDAFVAAGGRVALVTVVYNGFAVRTENLPEQQTARNRFGWKSGEKVAVIAGRIAEWKGQHVLLEALRSAKDWKACVVGDALFTGGDQLYKRRLEEMAKELTLEGRVTFTGFVEDPGAYYAAADAVVHCSTAPEPFGRVIVEGMLAGRPVIATNHGGATEILRDGATGFLVEPGNPIALARVLERIAEEPDTAARVALAGREDARKRFDLAEITKQVLGVLQKAAQ